MIVPYNDHGFSRNKSTSESEEVICTNALPITSKTVAGIILYTPCPEIEELAADEGIPVQKEYAEFDFDDDRWLTQ